MYTPPSPFNNNIKNYYYEIVYNNKHIHKLNQNELNNLTSEEIKNITLFSKIFINWKKQIILFTKDTPTLLNGKLTYYYATKEKYMIHYNDFQVLDTFDENMISKIIQLNPL